jgi:hypothetical protein
MGNSTIDTCRSCGQKQENMYGGGLMTYVLYCEKCGLQEWLTYRDKTVPPCEKCGGALAMNAEPACARCGGRSWDHGADHHLIWD